MFRDHSLSSLDSLENVDLQDLSEAKRRRRPIHLEAISPRIRTGYLDVGAAIATRCFDLGWVKRMANTRALKITKYGESGFARTFEIKL